LLGCIGARAHLVPPYSHLRCTCAVGSKRISRPRCSSRMFNSVVSTGGGRGSKFCEKRLPYLLADGMKTARDVQGVGRYHCLNFSPFSVSPSHSRHTISFPPSRRCQFLLNISPCTQNILADSGNLQSLQHLYYVGSTLFYLLRLPRVVFHR